MRDLTPLEVELHWLENHNSYLASRMTNCFLSAREFNILQNAKKINDLEIEVIQNKLGLKNDVPA